MTTITVTDITRDAIVAQGKLDDSVILMEGAYYFEPDQVRQDHLVVTTRTYTCPYKGTCFWIDLQSESGVLKDVGWVYTKPRPGYEHIRNKFAFAYGMRPGIMVEKS